MRQGRWSNDPKLAWRWKSIILLTCAFAITLFVPIHPVHAQPPGQYFDHIVFIIDENQGECDILYDIVQGCQQTTAPAPYMDSLYQSYSGATHYSSLDGTTMSGTCGTMISNSQPNYIALTS